MKAFSSTSSLILLFTCVIALLSRSWTFAEAALSASSELQPILDANGKPDVQTEDINVVDVEDDSSFDSNSGRLAMIQAAPQVDFGDDNNDASSLSSQSPPPTTAVLHMKVLIAGLIDDINQRRQNQQPPAETPDLNSGRRRGGQRKRPWGGRGIERHHKNGHYGPSYAKDDVTLTDEEAADTASTEGVTE